MLKSNHPPCQTGFSLIELVMTIVILGIVAAIGSKILQASFTSYSTNQSVTTANTQARLAFERMSRDIHGINSPSDITTASASQLVFNDINGTNITYRLTGTQLMRNNLVLADGVSSFSLSYLNKNAAATTTLSAIRYIIVNLGITQNNVSYTFRTTINTINY